MKPSERTLAAVLIDFENVYYFLKNHPKHTGTDVTESVVEMITALRVHLVNEYQEHALSLDAYGDFDRIEEAAQSDLYLLGVETHNVLGTEHKNAADMRLCIDSLDIFYNRQEIASFVFVAGDRDYIPVIQYLKKRNKIVRVVGFTGAHKSVAGDLLTIVGPEYFIDATPFIKELNRPAAVAVPIAQSIEKGVYQLEPGKAFGSASPVASPKPQLPTLTTWRPPDTEGFLDWHKYEQQALELLFKHFPQKPEVWLTPYLHKLRAELGELTESERKQLISRLEAVGCFRVEKRGGVPNDFSVLVMNWNSHRVRNANLG